MTGHFHGERLKALRSKAGVTQLALAQAIGAVVGRAHTDSAVRGWEDGRRPPRVHDIVALADYFGVSTDYLLGRSAAPDMLAVDAKGRAVVIEVKSTVGGTGHQALVDRAAAAADGVADATAETARRTPRKKRA